MINYYITIFVYTCDPAEACDRSYAMLQEYQRQGWGGCLFARKLINGRVHVGIKQESAHELLPGVDMGGGDTFTLVGY
jgi:hypothetical protein